MKKKIVTLMSLFILSTVTACSNSKSSDLMISEFISGDDYNKVVEIYNNSDKELDLKNYAIGIYNVKDSAGSPSLKVNLEGKIASKGTYVISNSKADSDILSKTNQKSDDLNFGGKEGISLMFKNEDLDSIGTLGARNQNQGMAYVRKTWMTTPSKVFNNTTDFLYYNAADAVKYLGEFTNSVTQEDLIAGPKFVNDYLNKEFYQYTTSYFGTGGAVEVKIKSNVDGDTTDFYFPTEANIEEYAKSCVYNSNGKYSVKVRYQDVDTPETQVQNNKVEEWGWPAKLNTAKLQNEAEHIYVQSNTNKAIVENYGRMLGFVFVVSGNDSKLVNFETIKNGYTPNRLEFNGDIKYKDCPYYNYFVEALNYAMENKLGLYGQKDPYWDYTNNKSKQL